MVTVITMAGVSKCTASARLQSRMVTHGLITCPNAFCVDRAAIRNEMKLRAIDGRSISSVAQMSECWWREIEGRRLEKNLRVLWGSMKKDREVVTGATEVKIIDLGSNSAGNVQGALSL